MIAAELDYGGISESLRTFETGHHSFPCSRFMPFPAAGAPLQCASSCWMMSILRPNFSIHQRRAEKYCPIFFGRDVPRDMKFAPVYALCTATMLYHAKIYTSEMKGPKVAK